MRRRMKRSATSEPHTARENVAVAALLVLLVLQLALAARWDGLTVDEMVYIGGGYRALFFSDYRMGPEQPPLAKMLAAAPLALLRLDVPEAQAGDAQMTWSDALLNESNRDRPLIGYARSSFVALSLVLALLLWRVARRLYGATAALVGLALYTFHPSLLAHGHLTTTDLPSAFTFFLTSWALWSWCQRPSVWATVHVGLAVAAALATRLTGALLLPAAGLVLIPWLWSRRARWRGTLVSLALLGLVVATVTFVALWAIYGFHYAPWPGTSCLQPISPELGVAGRVVSRLAEWQALPEAYLESLRFQLEHNRGGHWSYFMGEAGSEGWRTYYLVAYLIKNTPGFLIVTALIAAFVLRRARTIVTGAEWHWLAPALVVFCVASLARIQLGERYVLAIYPYLMLLAAAAVRPLLKWRHAPIAIGVALVLHAVPSLLNARAGYLTYFNLVAGGPHGGHRWLADSNIDWGQDLPRLADWMKQHAVDRIQLGYFGADAAERYGIQREDLPTWGASRPQYPAAQPFHGTIAVSANYVVGFLFPADNDPYAILRNRAPDDRAGVFFIYRMP